MGRGARAAFLEPLEPYSPLMEVFGGKHMLQSRQDGWREALNQLESAIDLLDEADAPGDIGGHLQLAIDRLKSAISRRHKSGYSGGIATSATLWL